MTPGIQEALARKLGLAPDECAALEAGDVSVLLGRAGRQSLDPMSLVLLATLMKREPPAPAPAADVERRMAKARDVVLRLREDLASAQSMVNYVAQVFGACSSCLGQNRLCLRCGGAGSPGSGEPMEEELMHWVEPALARVGWTLDRTAAANPAKPPDSPGP